VASDEYNKGRKEALAQVATYVNGSLAAITTEPGESPAPKGQPYPGPHPDLRTIHALYVQLSKGTQKDPDAMFSVFLHETAEGKSRLWLQDCNPGGLKYHPGIAILGHVYGRDVGGGAIAYAKFPDPVTGVAAHFKFVSQSRYAMMNGRPAEEQIEALRAAGYIEAGMDQDWKRSVLHYLDLVRRGALG